MARKKASRAAKAPAARNEHAASLHARAGHAGAAIAVDTRPKVVPGARGKGARAHADRKKFRAAQRGLELD